MCSFKSRTDFLIYILHQKGKTNQHRGRNKIYLYELSKLITLLTLGYLNKKAKQKIKKQKYINLNTKLPQLKIKKEKI